MTALSRTETPALAADALGITACLYAYSHLSFLDNPALAEMCAEQYHLLRGYMLEPTSPGFQDFTLARG